MTIETLGAFVAGVLVPLFIALLGKEPIGKWLLAGERRETSALATLTEVVRESITGWRQADSAYIKLAETMRGMQTEQQYYYQDMRDRAMERAARLERIEDLLRSLVTLMADKEA